MNTARVTLVAVAVVAAVACNSTARADQLATGDFDGDGRADLAIGVPFEDVNGQSDAGVVHVIYGSVQGLKAQADQVWHEDRPGVLDVAEVDDQFGYALAAGRFNDDEFDDLAVGVPGETINAVQDTGHVHLFLGSSNGLRAAADKLFRHDIASLNVGSGDRFGSALAFGDFQDDGLEEIVVGAPGGDTASTAEDAGFVGVILNNVMDFEHDVVLFQQGDSGVLGPTGIGFQFGFSLAVGDFNGDDFDDVAIGAPGATVSAQADAGAVAVLYGRAQGLSRIGDQRWNQNSAGVKDTAEVDDRFGYALAAGDFDGDGRDDLAIGIPDEGFTQNEVGAVAVLYGTANKLKAIRDDFWHQGSPGIAGTPSEEEFFGLSLSAGDFDGDGRDDLAIGVRDDDVDGVPEAGSVNVLYGSGSGLSNNGDQLWHQNRPGIADQAEQYDTFGWCVAAGDFDDDGRLDLAVSAPSEELSGVEMAGVVHVIYGAGSGLRSAGDQRWHQNVTGIGDSVEEDDSFGGPLLTF